ncbi:ATP/GTP-binding protein [Luteibacter aegosomaticola]|uniref:GTP-binding protein n=1 Tax=Luteibacter aegosomaticola TaxID=2911538 RepID=UPI001FFB6E01|nr:ATP/GTP-binding protein [Luteibacter aegosomaticola]UPG88458.1 ATP/GTP-binding protein [Luteibacter aegosomaticola]
MMQRDYKIVFLGPMGAGKTTAISAISTRPPVATEVRNTDLAAHGKASTTVALDYGEVALDDGGMLRLYGVPGQSRFAFMWPMVGKGALGAVLLMDATRADGLTGLDPFLDSFDALFRAGRAVVGVGRSNEPGAHSVDDVSGHLAERGLFAPVFSVDVRQRADVHLLLDVLFVQIEAQADAERTEVAP